MMDSNERPATWRVETDEGGLTSSPPGVGAIMPQPDQMLSVTKAFQTPILACSLGQLATSFGGFFATCTAMYLCLAVSLWIDRKSVV